MRTTVTSARTERRLGMLDVLRLFAAVAVVAFHYTARHSPGWDGAAPEELAGVGQWASYGRMGVPLFFVISGFVLLMSAWGRDVRGFVASRVGRLFPAYWVAVALSLVLVLFIWPENPAFLGHEISKAGALLNFTMVQGAFGVPDVDGPYWTLWYEARFYLLIAVFMHLGITRNRVLAVCALWPVVGALASANGAGLVSTLLMPDYAPFFAGGMLLYLIHRDGHDLGTWLLVGLQVTIAVNFTTGVYPGILSAETPWVPSTTVIAAICVACFGLVALVTLTRVASRSAGWMTVAGALTYPVYLVHENLGWWVIHLVRDRVGPWGAVALATVVAFAAATLLHHLVEKPFGPRLRKATLRMLSQSEGGRASDDGRDGAHRAGRGRAADRRTPGIPVPTDVRSAADDRPSAVRHPVDTARHTERRPTPRADRDGSGLLGPSTVALPEERPEPRGALLTGQQQN
ncbi:Peptidoglycan/LPS O-acetylase OafA/YrhL, contains acyltransferase and SGNH-hydrolase domains [Geodermatophilus obscurus]|uniref:Peptidoglycan/LPS O-acetylase OafA/YrhL, contains acyltransferase and SGNH-hydrolase domains n=1 Tax=Geodermatophilus obscurus TaxID=1861 RepID=A0A1I5FD26_9ACTN|nr:acyltransferase [Geodermatophilus obscurus]SFO21523.1 Peptidoglycan/LPS O-acetylase OafA/YrhL, contains acyltransferase and SGNH-hydrolase domains [Geodermatophilus obscurus]